MKIVILALLLLGAQAQPSLDGGETSGIASSGHCTVHDVVLLAGQGGTGSEALALFLDKSGVFQMTGRLGRCAR